MWLVSHIFHPAHAAGTLKHHVPPARDPQPGRALDALAPSQLRLRRRGSRGEGNIRFVITGYREAADLGVERCAESLEPDEILTSIEVRHPDGSKIARVTVRGRDATVKQVGDKVRRCAIRAATRISVPQMGLGYEFTVDGETKTTYTRWPRFETGGRCDTYDYFNPARVRLSARGWEPWPSLRGSGEIVLRPDPPISS